MEAKGDDDGVGCTTHFVVEAAVLKKNYFFQSIPGHFSFEEFRSPVSQDAEEEERRTDRRTLFSKREEANSV